MEKMLAIIGSTLAFALIGVAVAYMAVQNLPLERGTGKNVDMVILLSVLPPFVGTVLGFAVGCVAAYFYVAKKTST